MNCGCNKESEAPKRLLDINAEILALNDRRLSSSAQNKLDKTKWFRKKVFIPIDEMEELVAIWEKLLVLYEQALNIIASLEIPATKSCREAREKYTQKLQSSCENLKSNVRSFKEDNDYH